ncbi:type II toxin-antitoxin system HicA family toxin [Corynebacterium xerosis]|nr:type II toxin-antitoxin system HicA family toxin [Corynebacterium xerosis]
MKATKLRGILKKELGYKVVPKRGKGSHTVYESEEYGRLVWGFHNKRNLAPREVRNVLVRQVGLTIEQAKEVLNVD